MATLNQILKDQEELIGKAKQTLEKAQNNPPPTNAPSDLINATVAVLEARVKNLERARDDAKRQITEQINAYNSEIAALKSQIKDDKK